MANFLRGFGEAFSRSFDKTYDRARSRRDRREDRAYQKEQLDKQIERARKEKREKTLAAITASTPESKQTLLDTQLEPNPFTGTTAERILRQAAEPQEADTFDYLARTPSSLIPEEAVTPEEAAAQERINLEVAERRLGRIETAELTEDARKQREKDFRARTVFTSRNMMDNIGEISSLRTNAEIAATVETHLALGGIRKEQAAEAAVAAMNLYEQKSLFDQKRVASSNMAIKAGALARAAGGANQDMTQVQEQFKKIGYKPSEAELKSIALDNKRGLQEYGESDRKGREAAASDYARTWAQLQSYDGVYPDFGDFLVAHEDQRDFFEGVSLLEPMFNLGTAEGRLRDQGRDKAVDQQVKAVTETEKARQAERDRKWLSQNALGVGERLQKFFNPVRAQDPGRSKDYDEIAQKMMLSGQLDGSGFPTDELMLYMRDNPNALPQWEQYYEWTGKLPSVLVPLEKMAEEVKAESEVATNLATDALAESVRLGLKPGQANFDPLLTAYLKKAAATGKAVSQKQIEMSKRLVTKTIAAREYEALAEARGGERKTREAREANWRIIAGDNSREDYILIAQLVPVVDEDGVRTTALRYQPHISPSFLQRRMSTAERKAIYTRMGKEMDALNLSLNPGFTEEGSFDTPGGNRGRELKQEDDEPYPSLP